jgi:hypothetical protein
VHFAGAHIEADVRQRPTPGNDFETPESCRTAFMRPVLHGIPAKKIRRCAYAGKGAKRAVPAIPRRRRARSALPTLRNPGYIAAHSSRPPPAEIADAAIQSGRHPHREPVG